MINVTFSVRFPSGENTRSTTLKVEMPVLPHLGQKVYLGHDDLKKDGLRGTGRVNDITPSVIGNGHVHYVVVVDLYELDKDK